MHGASCNLQMVSLLHLADINEEGVTFQSPTDGQRMLLTPEHSMAIQNRLGADIMMALDDVVPSTAEDPARPGQGAPGQLCWEPVQPCWSLCCFVGTCASVFKAVRLF